MTAMLASVRDCAEAHIALAGGCDWLDIKEPRQGALGQVALAVVTDIVCLAAERVPVSATIGDRWDDVASIPEAVMAMAATGVGYVKVGLRARGLAPSTAEALRAACGQDRKVIAVCMAEQAPTAQDIALLAACGVRGAMLDTMDKHGPGLTGLLEVETLAAFVASVHGHGLLAGLAGKLGAADVATLRPCGADYLGFRSALCAAGERRGGLDEHAFATVRAACHGHAPCISINTNEVA